MKNFLLLIFIAFISASLLNSCVSPNDSNNPFGYVDTTGQDIFINEVNASGTDWVELYNRSSQPFDLSGYVLIDNGSGNIPLVIDSGTIILPDSFIVFENLPFGLSAEADGINLFNRNNQVIDAHTYTNGQIVSGKTIGRIPDGGVWTTNLDPTKGYSNVIAPPDTGNKVFLNEILATSATGQADFIELYNKSLTQDINISGYTLIDNNAGNPPYVIPNGTVILRDSFVVFTNGVDFQFGLSSGGDEVHFKKPDGVEVDAYTFGAQTVDRTVGRLPDGGAWNPSLTPTKGYANLP